ncbi:MAG: hypothetical protein N2202_02525 [Proteobacteria bacterium]|nr:hypothetical protein [Pseudomonadota bacterium]
MGKRGFVAVFLMITFLTSFIVPKFSYAQAQYPVMTLGDGTVVKLSQDQLQLLINHPGIMYTQLSVPPKLVGEQMAIPLPQELGGGYIIGSPEAIASALNNSGIAIGATSANVIKATAASGSITLSGSLAGANVLGGITAGTIAVGAGITAVVVGGAIAITGAGGGGGGTTPVITTGHH